MSAQIIDKTSKNDLIILTNFETYNPVIQSQMYAYILVMCFESDVLEVSLAR